MLERRAVPLTLTNSVPGSLGTQLDEGRGGAYFQDILGECEDLPHRGFPEDSEMDLFPLKACPSWVPAGLSGHLIQADRLLGANEVMWK